MINNINLKKQFSNSLLMVSLFVVSIFFTSCDYEYDLPETGSIADATPPSASFSATETDDYLTYTFSNTSSSATEYVWDFGDGNTSTDLDGENTYAAEGTYTVTLTVSDALGVTSTYTDTIVVAAPEVAVIPNPVLLNADFTKLAKSSGSDCVCAGWINTSIGSQGESSTGNDSDVLKFDNDESDTIYQEFEVVAEAEYSMTVVISFSSLVTGGLYPSSLEMRILAGSGYVSDYSPAYYTDTTLIPQDGFGYTSLDQVETADNNILVETLDNPSDSSYISYTYTFNSGDNTSVALFARGIGGDGDDSDGKGFPVNNGDEEIRIDSVTITAVNE